MVRCTVLFAVAAVGTARLALGWGSDGHQLVGAVADTLIQGTHAGTHVKNILGTETLQQAALWADCVKGTDERNTPFKFNTNPKSYPECKPFETTAGIAAMVDYVKRNHDGCSPGPDQETCHKQYHYADVAIQRASYDATHEHGTSNHDIVA